MLKRISKESGFAQLCFNFQQSVIFGDAFAAAGGTGLDLSASHSYRKIGNKGVFRFTGTMGNDISPTSLTTEVDCFDGFRYGADLVELDQDGIGCFLLNAAGNVLGVGYENIVPDNLNLIPLFRRLPAEALPVVLGKAVFNRDNGIFLDLVFIDRNHLLAVFCPLV
ncbi:MAG: hypothetical protein A4E69_03109 [Syntrophus sp. PtaB.Bin138]|nr:MAG: hypothetical protein A4E69_03109 [Syntrophus sp. PtaB.Bin138]